jgi:hypothetical protein
VSPNRGRVPAPAGMSEAWRGFCRPGASFVSYTRVAVHNGLNLIYLSPYWMFIKGSGDTLIYPPAQCSLKSRDTLQKP